MVNLPKAKGPWYEFRNESGTNGPAELLIYDVIEEGWGVSPSSFARALASLDADELTVRLNSPGGSVYDGIAILNSLRGARQKVTTVVDGLAASIASVIAMAGDEIVMMPNSEMMIHNAWTFVSGTADDLARAADALGKTTANIASIYADKTGLPVQFWTEQMAAETWYSAQEAVDVGLASRVGAPESTSNVAAMARNSFDLTYFNFAGRMKAPAPVTESPSAAAEAKVPQEKEAIVATLKESLADRFGINADADDEAFIKAAEDALAAKNADGDGESAVPADPTIEQAQKVAAQNGMVLVESDAFEAVKANAQLGVQARNQQIADANNAKVDEAIHGGKITPARREHWLNQLKADPEGISKVIDELPQVFNVNTEAGHAIAGNGGENPGAKPVEDDDKFKNWSL